MVQESKRGFFRRVALLAACMGCAQGAELAVPQWDLSVMCRAVTLSWDPVAGATGYRLWYQPDGKGDWQYADFGTDSTDLSFTLDDGARYSVNFQALRGGEAGEMDYSKWLMVGSFPIPPHIDYSFSGNRVDLRWNPVADATGYRLWYQDGSPGASWDYLELGAGSLGFSAELWRGASFNLTIQALDGGDDSDFAYWTDIAAGGISSFTVPPTDDPQFSGVADVHPARSDAPHAGVLQDCVYSNTRTKPCSLATLPLLGQSYPDPTVEQVMQRVLVSHDWMGARFASLLAALPEDLRWLLRSVTAIVIASDVRPSFYWERTGAIYLDPGFLWMTQDEKATISEEPDYREGCGDALAYRLLWRYVKDNDYAYSSNDSDAQRSFDEVKYDLAHLLYHELTHAADYFPPDTLAGLAPSQSVYQAAYLTKGRRPSDLLQQLYPLASANMKDHARIQYLCTDATCGQVAAAPATLASAMASDRASAFYSYATKREDFAMLAEEFLMYNHFGIERDLAVTAVPAATEPTQEDFIVDWGQRRRIATGALRERLRYVLSRIFPGTDFSVQIAALGTPTALRTGADWMANLNPQTAQQTGPQRKTRVAHPNLPRDWTRPHH